MKNIAITILLFTFLFYAPSIWAWTEADSNRETAWQIINFTDYRQTIQISKEPYYYEKNPLLGDHPSRGKIDRYFITCTLLHYEVSRTLPPKYRSIWQWTTIGFSSAIVYRNFQLGLQLNF